MSKQPLHSDVEKVLLLLDQLDRAEHVSLYQALADSYYIHMAMYSRAIAMYKKSIEAHDGQDSGQVREKLAELLIHLYGKDGFDDALALARDPVCPEWWIERKIKAKQEAIERRDKKAVLDQDHPALTALVGESQHILDVCQHVLKYAHISDPVLITGASGTGKDVVARLLAEVSERKFVPFNCGAVAEGVIESELFGHVKGAFTGATADRPGLFETPGDPVIFLDEIGDTSPKFQAALLRVIDNREFYRVGDTRTLRKLAGSTKIVSATAKNLPEEVKAGRFRHDLFQRIQAFPIHCEPLAKRPEDIQLLVRHFLATERDLQQYGPFSKSDIDHWITWVLPLDPSSKNRARKIETFSLEGNIRELRGQVRRAVLEGKFPRKGDRPFVDRLGAMTYTKKEVEWADWAFAVELCPLQQDACKLMGRNAKTGQKILKSIGLSKQQRKRQAPQA
jgi:transcriptional regulator with GAF, ATPase, and Fis domain